MPLILPSQRIARPNPLAYPAGAVPRFDPSHPAAKGMASARGISALPSNGGLYIDLVSGRRSTLSTGAFGSAIDGGIGPVGTFNNGYAGFLNQSTGLDQKQTLAFILRLTSNTPLPVLMATGDSSTIGGVAVYLTSPGGLLHAYGNTGDDNSGLTVPLGSPCFIAVSTADSSFGLTNNFLVKVLSTGQVFTSSITSGITITANLAGNIYIGSDTFNRPSNAVLLAAAMWAPNYMTPSQLLAWASDPWAFWYPNKTINLTSTAAAAGFLAAWARNSNLPVIGTGNY